MFSAQRKETLGSGFRVGVILRRFTGQHLKANLALRFFPLCQRSWLKVSREQKFSLFVCFCIPFSSDSRFGTENNYFENEDFITDSFFPLCFGFLSFPCLFFFFNPSFLFFFFFFFLTSLCPSFFRSGMTYAVDRTLKTPIFFSFFFRPVLSKPNTWNTVVM